MTLHLGGGWFGDLHLFLFHLSALYLTLSLFSFLFSSFVSLAAVPGAFLQLNAMLTSGGEISALKIVSFIISVFLVVVTINGLDARKDTNLFSRTLKMRFHGLIPESGLSRIGVTLGMFGMSASQFVVRISLLILIGNKSKSLLVPLLGGEFGALMLYKVARQDWRYWPPLPGAASVIISILSRLLVLQLVASTSFLQGRHPLELGGVAWTFTHVLSQGALLASVFLLEFDVALSGFQLQLFGAGAVVVWWFAFSLLLHNGEKGYRGSFFCTLTGKELEKLEFVEGMDEQKSFFFTNHMSLWVDYKGEIIVWLEDNWERFENEKPAWFTAEWKQKLPNDMTRRQRRPGNASGTVEGMGGGGRRNERKAGVRGNGERERRGK